MASELITYVFYAFAAILLASSLAVISSRNPVHAVFFLILAFFNAAGLFVLIGAEYIAMTLVIVYVGAVAVLFLFVVMMLNINFEKLRAGYIHYLPIGLFVASLLFVEIGALIYLSFDAPVTLAAAAEPIPSVSIADNAEAIGRVLYTKYVLLFQLAGVILLVAMIGAIVLTLRHRPGVKRQKIYAQISRKRSESVTLVQVKTGEGA
jgi:NADH-quinone oxidoreductase subunit J